MRPSRFVIRSIMEDELPQVAASKEFFDFLNTHKNNPDLSELPARFPFGSGLACWLGADPALREEISLSAEVFSGISKLEKLLLERSLLFQAFQKLWPNLSCRADFLKLPSTSFPEDFPPTRLLLARYGIVPFFGRESELASLDAWADHAKGLSVRLLYAASGTGKTRLAQHWMKTRIERGELAGFCTEKLDTTLTEKLLCCAPLILCFDEAETLPELPDFLKNLAEQQASIRILLLAHSDAGWWSRIKEKLEAFYIDVHAIQLSGIYQVEDREQIFKVSVNAFTEKLGAKTAVSVPDLSHEHFSRVLYVHMAALSAVLGLKAQADTLVDMLLEQEINRWIKKTGRKSKDDIKYFRERFSSLVAAVSLRGGLQHRKELKRLQQEFKLGHDAMDVLEAFFPDEKGWIGALEPDLLGDRLMYRCIQKNPPGLIEKWLAGGADEAWVMSFWRLGRIEVEHPELGEELSRMLANDRKRLIPAFQACIRLGKVTAFSSLGKRLAAELQKTGAFEEARIISENFPTGNILLMEAGVWAENFLLQISNNNQTKAKHLLSYGIRLLELGQWEAALTATEEAVATYRTLAQQNPVAFLPNLAASLTNLGAILSNVGQRKAALVATKEAVTHFSALAQQNPMGFLPDLASSLSNLGARLFDMGQWGAALAATEEAVTTYRTLAQQNPAAFLPGLAGSLANLSAGLSKMGQWEPALAATEEAVTTYRTLAQQNPATFLPGLVGSLANLGAGLSKLGQWKAALAATEEAVTTYRTLVQQNPAAFLPDLARSLSNLGALLSDMGQWEAGIAAAEEAVTTYRTLVQQNPVAFLPDLARSLSNLGALLSKVGEVDAALTATTEVVTHYRTLTQQNPATFLPDLARSLSNLGNQQLLCKNPQSALPPTQEATTHYRALSNQYPQLYTPPPDKNPLPAGFHPPTAPATRIRPSSLRRTDPPSPG